MATDTATDRAKADVFCPFSKSINSSKHFSKPRYFESRTSLTNAGLQVKNAKPDTRAQEET